MKGKILVVDDDPGIVKTISALLKSNGYGFIGVSDGNQVMKVAKENRPDLIIMDIIMPNLQGGDVVRILKSDSSTRDIPVIFLTSIMSNAPEETENKSVNVDGQFFKVIAKPF